ncbi:MAG TPA: TonB system transport protein ExbD [Terriglobia bacterium]|nr:TonB system transport protein ExbD [Terriglobia bacterium]
MAVKLNLSEDDLVEQSEINVTPFIDVILVLLIIFMVAAPLATVDVPIELPSASARPQQRPSEPIFLSVKADLSLALGDESVAKADLPARLASASKGDKQQRIFLRADKHVSYGELMAVMNLLRDAGYLKIALVGLDRNELDSSETAVPAAAAPQAPVAAPAPAAP